MSEGRFRLDVMGELGALRRYARSLARDGIAAEDLVHDALVRAYEKRDRFRDGGNLRAWLLSILHNVFIDDLRGRRAEHRRIEAASETAATHHAPAQEHQLRLAQVRRAFMDLPEAQRAALHLVAIEGLSFAEAAGTLGIPPGTLMSRLARARATLRAMEEVPADGVAAGTAPARTDVAPRLRIVGGRDDRTG